MTMRIELLSHRLPGTTSSGNSRPGLGYAALIVTAMTCSTPIPCANCVAQGRHRPSGGRAEKCRYQGNGRVNVLARKPCSTRLSILPVQHWYSPVVSSSSPGAILRIRKYCPRNHQELRKGPGAFTNSVILRFTNIYGTGGAPFANSVIATFAHLAKEGLPIRINGDGTQRRDYLHVSDAVAALIQATRITFGKTETVDICTGRRVSLNTVVQVIGQYSSTTPTVEYNKDAGRDDWPLKKNYLRAKHLLSWEPRVSLEHGLKELIVK